MIFIQLGYVASLDVSLTFENILALTMTHETVIPLSLSSDN
jgi:hypothetical protein